MPPRPISTAVLGGFPHPFASLKMFHQSCRLGPNLSHEVMDAAQLDMKMCHPGNQTKTGMFKNVFEESTGWQGGGRGSRGCFSANAFLPPFFSQTLAVVQQPRERNIYVFLFWWGVGRRNHNQILMAHLSFCPHGSHSCAKRGEQGERAGGWGVSNFNFLEMELF